MALVEETYSNFIWDIDLVDFVTSVFVPFGDDFLKVFEQIDNQHLSRCCSAQQNMFVHRVELHSRYLVLSENCEQGSHLVLTIPKRYFLHSTPANVVQLLLERLARGVGNQEHVIIARTPQNVADREVLVVLVEFDVGVAVAGGVEGLDVLVEVADGQAAGVRSTAHAQVFHVLLEDVHGLVRTKGLFN